MKLGWFSPHSLSLSLRARLSVNPSLHSTWTDPPPSFFAREREPTRTAAKMGDATNNKKILQNIKMPEQSNDYRVVSSVPRFNGNVPDFGLPPGYLRAVLCALCPPGGVWGRWRRQEFPGPPVHQGNVPRELHPDHRGHLQAGKQDP